MKSFNSNKLNVKVYDSRGDMGKAAAVDIKNCINSLLKDKSSINMIFAAAPSQNEVLAELASFTDIEWNRINAYHMDEYVGLSKDAPQGFGNFLKKHLFRLVNFKTVNYIDSTAQDSKAECERYSSLLAHNPTDIVVMGIGENGHIAFNDPEFADFNDTKRVKVVNLDNICRNQQVHDGCFETLQQVPKTAITLTVPSLTNATFKFCIVPAITKANAVKRMIEGEISEACPATILRTCNNASLYLDQDSSSMLTFG